MFLKRQEALHERSWLRQPAPNPLKSPRAVPYISQVVLWTVRRS
uniref:Uncharacterized protein n=1 Tax=Utricularia reniformis TaxID=192314 RepID=A0A1Y0B018_9LAMI|nr:hypothetical protein AEK19_MT0501 [Utricularia reniformis]ART30757.1 hypothetical protein AEK19_MT0501 [Utricularia reniformis]